MKFGMNMLDKLLLVNLVITIHKRQMLHVILTTSVLIIFSHVVKFILLSDNWR